eukprot:m.163546 g.163546  ORF g.163546 m.163546 type:complete len:251 (+) comp38852_c0_seq54:1665-2417(+)
MLVNFLYSNADTVNHVECLDCLIQMGSDVFAEDGEGRTPYDLAQSCNSMPDVIDRLGTAQALFAVEKLKSHVAKQNEKLDWDLEKYFDALIRQVREGSDKKLKEDDKSAGLPDGDGLFKANDEEPRTELKSEAAEQELHSTAENNGSFDSLDLLQPRGVEGKGRLASDLLERLEVVDKEKEELEKRCQTLVQTIGKITATHQRNKQLLEEKLLVTLKEKDIAVQKINVPQSDCKSGRRQPSSVGKGKEAD